MRLPNRKPTYPYGDSEPLYFGDDNDVGIYWDGTQLVFDPVAAGAESMSIVFAAGITSIYGGQNAGDDIQIFANATNPTASLKMLGSGNIELDTQATIRFRDNGVSIFLFSFAANVATIQGGLTAGDDLELEANATEAGAAIILEGLGDVAINPAAGSYLKYGTHVGTGDAVSNGHIVIEDSGGTARKLMTTA